MLGNFKDIKKIYEYNKNGYEVNCKDCKHLNNCLEKGYILKQNAPPFLYSNTLTHEWDKKGNSCIFKNKEEYENS